MSYLLPGFFDFPGGFCFCGRRSDSEPVFLPLGFALPRGGASGFIRQAADRLYRLQAGVAACMDYPDEISDAEGTEQLRSGLLQLIEFLESAVDEKSSRLVSDGMHVVFFGTPHVGKSSLLNALLGEENRSVFLEYQHHGDDEKEG